jgi:hypothetical protein
VDLEAWVDEQAKAAQERINRSVGQKVRYAKEDIRKAAKQALAVIYENARKREAKSTEVRSGFIEFHYAGEIWPSI